MLRGLWIFVRLAALLALGAAAALAGVELYHAGTVQVAWGAYTVTTPLWALTAAGGAALVLTLLLYALAFWLISIPGTLRRRRERAGYTALTRGLAAVAAGDARGAQAQARRATKRLPEGDGLSLLLQAQAARLNGRDAETQAHFTALLESKEGEFFGLRGLVRQALSEGDHEGALHLAHRALRRAPKQGWIRRLVYDLLIKTRAWDDAYIMAPKVLDKSAAASDRRAIDMLRAREAQAAGGDPLPHIRRARKGAPDFVPGTCALVEVYLRTGKRAAAVTLLENAWRTAPHPDLAPLWEAAMPGKGGPVRWAERLAKCNPGHVDSALVLSAASRRAGLWGPARQHLADALELEDTARIYAARADLEEAAGAAQDVVQDWRARGRAAAPSCAWVCRETGRLYAHWAPLAEPHGGFNTMEWAAPAEAAQPLLPGLGPAALLTGGGAELEAPAGAVV